MKGRVIAINRTDDLTVGAGLIEDGRVIDLIIDPPATGQGDAPPSIGAVYLGKVSSQTTKGGTFVEIGGAQTAFLRNAGKHAAGEHVIVQISGYGEPGKAAPATNRVLYKGQIVILTPGAKGVNVSRQIKDPDERTRLTDAVAAAMEHLGADRFAAVIDRSGVIVRTHAAGQAEDRILRDLSNLVRLCTEMDRTASSMDAPGLIGMASPAFTIALTEWCHPMPDRIAFSDHARPPGPEPSGIVSCRDLQDRIGYDDPSPFDTHGVWDEIERLKSPRVELPSGAWMAVETTRAMVTVDVNTGGEFGGGSAMTANIEAARELPRQLRLRGLGGQIIVDFAPLQKAHRRKIEEVLKAAFRKDPIDTVLAGWTPLGNFELQRKRERRPLREVLSL